ncbi:metallophosphoesterase [Veronia pacifica]|uniref:Diadenosine tetraphosphatase n=1 Tax=Veronia pacifica TaxID=1080227 RepID=A0A1C3EI35_9GAMM|nr:metallophosphoesterase [Veronia pacifica]ODA32896.1 diadenosine tetraphosphatase [Veronia pacifica]
MQFSHLFIDARDKERVFVVGDIHGKLSLLKNTLQQVLFNHERDLLIAVGDLVDRGPESADTLRYFSQHPSLFSVIGNHELMLSKAFNVWEKERLSDEERRYKTHWLNNGGAWAENYSYEQLKEMADIVLDMPSVITCRLKNGKNIGISHAQPHSLNWREMESWQGDLMSNPRWIWGRTRFKGEPDSPVDHIDMTFHGHTRSKDVQQVSNSYFIDTASVDNYQGAFVLLEANTMQIHRGPTLRNLASSITQ